MKRLIILLFPLLSSCAVYDAITLTGFDPSEYRIIAEIRTDASVYYNTCPNTPMSQANAQALAYKTQLFENYSLEIPNNENTIKAAKDLNAMAQGLVTRYQQDQNTPVLFCRLKMKNIESTATIIQHVLGNRPR